MNCRYGAFAKVKFKKSNSYPTSLVDVIGEELSQCLSVCGIPSLHGTDTMYVMSGFLDDYFDPHPYPAKGIELHAKKFPPADERIDMILEFMQHHLEELTAIESSELVESVSYGSGIVVDEYF